MKSQSLRHEIEVLLSSTPLLRTWRQHCILQYINLDFKYQVLLVTRRLHERLLHVRGWHHLTCEFKWTPTLPSSFNFVHSPKRHTQGTTDFKHLHCTLWRSQSSRRVWMMLPICLQNDKLLKLRIAQKKSMLEIKVQTWINFLNSRLFS